MALRHGRLAPTRILLPLLSISITTHPFHSPPSQPPISMSPSSNGVDEAFVSTAVSILTQHRSKSRWNLLQLTCPSVGFSAATASTILLRLRRRPHLALRFFLWSRRRPLLCRHDPSSFAAAAHVAARNRFRTAALSLLRDAVRLHDPAGADGALDRSPELLVALASSFRAFDSAPFVFDLLIKAYLASKRIDRAVQIVRILGSRGIRPLVSTSNTLIRSISHERGSDACLEIYRELFKPEGAHVKVRVFPNVRTFNALLLSLYQEERLEGSEEIIKDMESFNCQPNVYTYSILMAGLCDDGRVDKARELWDEMLGKGIKADIMAFNTLISGYCNVGEMERAEELFREIELGGIEPSGTTFEHLIKGHCKVGDIDSALLLHGDMKRRGFEMEVKSVDDLLVEMCEKGKVLDGLKILREAMRREGFAPSRRSYEVLIGGMCEEGALEEATKLQSEMAGKGFDAGEKVYSVFIRAYGRLGDTKMVERLEQEMLSMDRNLEEV